MSTNEPVVKVKQLLQVCVLVNDLQKAMERYWNLFGIGPWRIYTFAPPFLTKTTLRGSERPYSMKLAVISAVDQVERAAKEALRLAQE